MAFCSQEAIKMVEKLLSSIKPGVGKPGSTICSSQNYWQEKTLDSEFFECQAIKTFTRVTAREPPAP